MPSAPAMPSVFELTCECGQKLTVSAGQAGSQVVCECGKTVEVPTIRELRKFAAPEAAKAGSVGQKADPRAAQDEKSRVVFSVLAICLVLGGLAIAGTYYMFQASIENQEIDPRFLAMLNTANEKIDETPLDHLWDEWKRYRDEGMGEHQAWIPVLNKERAETALYGVYFGLGTAVIGLVLFLFSMLLPRRTSAVKS